jgi:hypothetical protein
MDLRNQQLTLYQMQKKAEKQFYSKFELSAPYIDYHFHLTVLTKYKLKTALDYNQSAAFLFDKNKKVFVQILLCQHALCIQHTNLLT